ncbi:hypothetical protein BSZ35_12590 [Salinibacter sp. 10B]|uniref:peptidoglycan-binding domain-containing protein n=1 Tax=Salinibacter sp. 10B TaxID=1923971 RepID=UPI000CF465C7|nr:peptidoglycan-binding domain-containing protein [Salinibacter sp. 10B]PQJ35327.1 hypothetical protein BSZ35_12590 [Salinibacter sp. 10B]
MTRLRPRVENGAVEVMYRFQYPGDTADIVPEWKAPEGYVQPQFFYTVDVSGIIADSQDAKSTGVMRFVDDLDLRFVNEGGAPLANQTVELTLADGSTEERQTSGEGRVQLREVPPGPVHVGLAGYEPASDESESEADQSPPSEDATRLVMDTADATAGVATGGEETVCVVPPRIDLHLEHGLVGAKLAGTDYTLKIKTEDGSTSTLEGTVDSEGRLQQAVPVGAVAAALTLKTEGGTVTVPLDLTSLSAGGDEAGLQQRLAQAGVYGGKVDSKNGAVTRASVQTLQAQLGQSPTGTIPEMERPMLDGLRFRDA